MVDDNRIEGAASVAGGRVKDAFGGLTGDTSTQLSGKADQITGKAQGAYGKGVDGVRVFASDNPLLALLAASSVGLIMGFIAGRR